MWENTLNRVTERELYNLPDDEKLMDRFEEETEKRQKKIKKLIELRKKVQTVTKMKLAATQLKSEQESLLDNPCHSEDKRINKQLFNERVPAITDRDKYFEIAEELDASNEKRPKSSKGKK